jgi:hypothetical protein
MEEFTKLFKSDRDFVDSTAAARVNGLLDGHGRREALATEVPTAILAKIKQ